MQLTKGEAQGGIHVFKPKLIKSKW